MIQQFCCIAGQGEIQRGEETFPVDDRAKARARFMRKESMIFVHLRPTLVPQIHISRQDFVNAMINITVILKASQKLGTKYFFSEQMDCFPSASDGYSGTFVSLCA